MYICIIYELQYLVIGYNDNLQAQEKTKQWIYIQK